LPNNESYEALKKNVEVAKVIETPPVKPKGLFNFCSIYKICIYFSLQRIESQRQDPKIIKIDFN
jgi:hypothetical protein